MKAIKFKMVVTFSVVLLLMMAACTEKQPKENTQTIDIDFRNAISLKEAVSSMDVLMLQDSSVAHFPGDLTKVVWTGDSIFVLDARRDPGIYLYNSEGILTNSYTKKGNGPDEFVGLVDFNITPSEIILLDTYSTSQRIFLDRKFLFQHKEEAEEQARHFFSEGKNGGVWYDRGNIAYGSNKDKLIYVNGKKRKAILPVPKDIENVTFASPNVFFEVSNDTILYLPTVEPRIYKCYNEQAEIFCELNFGERWPDFSDGAKNENPLELMRRISDEGKVYSINMLSDGKDIAITFFCEDIFYILMLEYDDLSTYRLFKVDKETLKSLGALVTVTDGCLVFGEPGKLLKLKI